jgi:hypothetical protein
VNSSPPPRHRQGEGAIHVVETHFCRVEIAEHRAVGPPLQVVETEPRHGVQRAVVAAEIEQMSSERERPAIRKPCVGKIIQQLRGPGFQGEDPLARGDREIFLRCDLRRRAGEQEEQNNWNERGQREKGTKRPVIG